MSGHSEDPVAEESKRFFTFFNLSMILVAITGVEIVIIYVQTFEGSSIIGILFLTSILKFIGVVWWFMHLRWDKILNTILFLLGLVIALGTYFAVIYMGDTHPVIENFEVIAVEANWESGKAYSSKDFIKEGEVFYQAISDHTSSDAFAQDSDKWQKVKGIPHQISWKVTSGDLVEIHSEKPGNPFFHQYQPHDENGIEGSKISLLAQSATTEDFRIKVRSESFWVEND
jgi:cytochrome c oxidase subunit 4